MKRAIVLALIVAGGSVSMVIAASQGQRSQGPPVADIQKVKDNLYMVTGGGGNTAVFVTTKGVVVVDTKLAGWGQAILDKIKTVTDKPVTTIINTHTHPDHVGSNDFFGTTVEIVAHENTKTNMAKQDAFKGDNSKFLPKTTYKDQMSLLSGPDKIDLHYFGRGHTNGDAWVVFSSLGVAHAGDMFPGKSTPLIDPGNGGSGVAFPQTLAKAASGLRNVSTIITGHSTLMTPTDLKEYADFNQDFLTWAQAQLKAGKSADVAAAEYKIPEKYKGYTIGQPIPNTQLGGVRNNLQAIYDELKK